MTQLLIGFNSIPLLTVSSLTKSVHIYVVVSLLGDEDNGSDRECIEGEKFVGEGVKDCAYIGRDGEQDGASSSHDHGISSFSSSSSSSGMKRFRRLAGKQLKSLAFIRTNFL